MTQDTVSAESLLAGYTAHDRVGNLITGTLESGGSSSGGSGLEGYTNFATGTFTPIEDVAEWSIDTGIPYDSSKPLSQKLIVWNDTFNLTKSGFVLGTMQNLSANISFTDYCMFVASNSGSGFSGAQRKRSAVGFPSNGESVWGMSGLPTSGKFRAGLTYRWMLLVKTE